MRPARQQVVGIAWINRDVRADLMKQAKDAFPLETGGILLGYWSEDGKDVVVVAAVGPGPDAYHGKTRFIPDYFYQESEIARLYEQHGRRLQYLGDWHSHPGGTDELSWRDRLTMARIASSKSARVKTPLMAVIAGQGEWSLTMWQGAPGRAFFSSVLGGKRMGVQDFD